MDTPSTKKGWKHRIVEELINYWIIAAYLAVFLSVFTIYRRLVLARYEISYLHYGIAILKALVLAKFILIMDAMHLGRRLENRPLMLSAIYKVFVFTLCTLFFDLLEEVIRGLCKGQGLPGVREQLASMNNYEALANCLMIFFAFIPFFAFRELSRIIGREKMIRMFFAGRSAGDA